VVKRFICFLFSLWFLGLFSGVQVYAETPANPYIPKEINLWLDQEFTKMFQCQPQQNVITYSTNGNEKALLRQLVELTRLQLQTNLILIKQNEHIIELLEKLNNSKKGSKNAKDNK